MGLKSLAFSIVIVIDNSHCGRVRFEVHRIDREEEPAKLLTIFILHTSS